MDFTSLMDTKEKSFNKHRLGLAIKAVIEKNKNSNSENAITSLRKLAAASGVEYAIIQKVTTGQKDPQFTTLISLAEGLNLNLSELLSEFENISEYTVTKQMNEYQKKRKKRN